MPKPPRFLITSVSRPRSLLRRESLTGAAFALLVDSSDDQVAITDKFLYELFVVSALSTQITIIVVATFAMGKLTNTQDKESTSIVEYIVKEAELEWVTARFLATGCGPGSRLRILRLCGLPGNHYNGTLYCVAFVDDIGSAGFGRLGGVPGLPVRFAQLAATKAKSSPPFAAALLALVITTAVVTFASFEQVSGLL